MVGPVLGAFVGGRGSRAESGSRTCRGRCSSAPTTRVTSTSRSSVARWDGTADIVSPSAAADDYWFQRRLYKLVVSWFAAVPFRRMGRGAESIRAVEGLLDDGWRVVIFPEGTRSRTGAIGHVQAGGRIDRRARRRGGAAGPDRRPVGHPAARCATATTATARPDTGAIRATPGRHRGRNASRVHRAPGSGGPGPLTDAVLVSWTSQPVVLAILLAWGFGEAVALPIVPDVLLGLLALATPAALGLPLVAAIAGARRRFGRPRRPAPAPARCRGEDHRPPARSRAAWDGGGAGPHRASRGGPRVRPGGTRAAVEGVRRRAHRPVRGSGADPAWHVWRPSTA